MEQEEEEQEEEEEDEEEEVGKIRRGRHAPRLSPPDETASAPPAEGSARHQLRGTDYPCTLDS